MKLDWNLSLPLLEDPVKLASQMAKPFEGLRLDAYYDCVGYPTQGYGHLLSREIRGDLSIYPRWTQHEADMWLERDMQESYRSVLRLCRIPLTPRQYAALTDFAFNLGAGNLQASTLLRMVNRHDFVGAADQFVRWNKAGGIVMRGLTRRREAERDLFLSGVV